MEEHEHVVLQQRIGARAVEPDRHHRPGRERVRGPEADQREEPAHDEHHDERPTDELVAGARTEAPCDRRGEAGEHQQPHQDRALERAPHRRHVVDARGRRRADLLDVGERVVARLERALHRDGGQERAGEDQPGVDGRLTQPDAIAAVDGEGGRQRPDDRRAEHDEQPGVAERTVDGDGDHAEQSAARSSASSRRSSLTATYSSECRTSTRSPRNVAAESSKRPCTTTGRHSLKMPPGSPS